MPANKTNYIVIYDNDSQVYGTASKQIALETPPPAGVELTEKKIFFITYQPDNGLLSVHPVDRDEVLNATLKLPTPKKKAMTSDEEALD